MPKIRDYVKELQNNLKDLAGKMGYKDWNEACAKLTPIIPEPIRWICEFGQIFNDKETINHLLPMIYV